MALMDSVPASDVAQDSAANFPQSPECPPELNWPVEAQGEGALICDGIGIVD